MTMLRTTPFTMMTLWAILAWPAVGETVIDFGRDVRPILADNCFKCHGPDRAKRKSGLRLDTRDGATADRGGHRAIVPRDLASSELYRRITSDDVDERMPPAKSGKTLTKPQIDVLRSWIEQGAVWKPHWSLSPPNRPDVPAVNGRSWVRNPIDAFILVRLEKEGLTPSLEATKETLLRRVTLDMTGLPPTLAELDAFRADASPSAYEKAVDRLLASPRYGERMVWEWLDAARYADSNGYQGDNARTMWPWRDWAIDALNRNLPFDQFTVEQLAGDLLPKPTTAQLIATGFHRNHMLNGEGGRILEESRVDYVVDRVDTTVAVWLGMTLGCARCHDHKYDAFSQQDYYQIFAFFNNLPETGGIDRYGSANPDMLVPSAEQKAEIGRLEAAVKKLDAEIAAADKALAAKQKDWEQRAATEAAKLPAPIQAALKLVSEKRSPEQARQLREHFLNQDADRAARMRERDRVKKELDQKRKQVPRVMIMKERPDPRPTHILLRGAYDKPGARVQPSPPGCLPPFDKSSPRNRLGLAKWLVDPRHPLTARVTVNRYWQTFFGTGLVKTAEDFGIQGERPSHPELLDWLATEFVRGGWNVKALHKLIVTSATYRQRSVVSPARVERDPENRLLARGPRRRLPSWMIRDQALTLSGLLVNKLGGPPVKPYQPPGIWEEMTFGFIKYEQGHGDDLYRRTLYTFWRRTVAPTLLFDVASRQVCTVRQAVTNTPLHALALLNDVTYVEAARRFAERIMTAGASTPAERLGWAFRVATARHPTLAEVAVLQRRWETLRGDYARDRPAAIALVGVGESKANPQLDPVELAAYTGVAMVILNLDEVISAE